VWEKWKVGSKGRKWGGTGRKWGGGGVAKETGRVRAGVRVEERSEDKKNRGESE